MKGNQQIKNLSVTGKLVENGSNLLENSNTILNTT